LLVPETSKINSGRTPGKLRPAIFYNVF
jgi:hypothetical protein